MAQGCLAVRPGRDGPCAQAMAFSSLRCVRLEKGVFRSLVGRWCNKHPWSSVPFSSYATSMKRRAVGPSLLAPPPEGGLLSFTSMRLCGSHRPRLRFFLYGPLFLLFVFVFFVSSMGVCLCCPSRRVLWSPCSSCLCFIGATHVPPKSNPSLREGGGSSFSYFTFVVFFSCLRFFDVGVHTGLFCSCSSRTIAVGTTTEGGMARFRLRFRVCS